MNTYITIPSTTRTRRIDALPINRQGASTSEELLSYTRPENYNHKPQVKLKTTMKNEEDLTLTHWLMLIVIVSALVVYIASALYKLILS
jgi:hypothetical protein